jgi:hypothetical protein
MADRFPEPTMDQRRTCVPMALLVSNMESCVDAVSALLYPAALARRS